MTTRRSITAALERRIFMHQLAEGYWLAVDGLPGVFLTCPLCRDIIVPGNPVIHEHMTPLCVGGADDETNIRLVHKQCADRKTNGSKATSYGSDSHAKAKVDRITGVTGNGPKRKLPKGRGFDKRLKRKIGGKVEVRNATAEG